MSSVLLSYFLEILILVKRKSYACGTLATSIYDYEFGLTCNFTCKDLDSIMDEYNFSDQLFDINDYMFDYLYLIIEVELDEMAKIKNTRNVHDIIDEMSIYCRKVSMNDWYFIKTILIIALISIFICVYEFMDYTCKQKKRR